MQQLPILISRNNVIFPGCCQFLEVARNFSLSAIHLAIEKHDSQVIVVSQKKYNLDVPKPTDFFDVGTLSKLKIVKQNLDGSVSIELKGMKRVMVKDVEFNSMNDKKQGAWFCRYEFAKEKPSKFEDIEQFVEIIKNKLNIIFKEKPKHLFEVKVLMANPGKRPSIFLDRIAHLCVTAKSTTKQKWLSEFDVYKRAKAISELSDLNVSDKEAIDSVIKGKVNRSVSKHQKEYYLREKLKAIKEELGEIASRDAEILQFRKQLEQGEYPEHIRKKINEELNRFEYSSSLSGESAILRTYIDWLLALPWLKESTDATDFKKIEKILNSNHTALEDVKDRVLEYIAVKLNKGSNKGAVICLVGPPGVGKTSFAQSIAKSLNKKYIRIALGGMEDEAELRGHRRTYIGAMPGRIMKSLKQSGVKNPLLLLDEIDKLSSSEPVGVLLEILDPSQNNSFSDNFVEEGFDLSNVMFVATANCLDNIPHPLLDRMEIIHLSSYTEFEKLQIFQNHLLHNVLKEHGLKVGDIDISTEDMSFLIRRYTKEAGVRELNRVVSKVVRKIIKNHLSKGTTIEKLMIDKATIIKLLGVEKYDYTIKDKKPMAGVVNGMAYTEFGGDLLPIEVNFHDGKGNLNLTGNLKETMRESAGVALAFVKKHSSQFKIKNLDWGEIDINLHVPSGGIPKDGPSAGVTIVSALISALCSHSVDPYIAMTGEMTLRGKILPIGGLKEKILSAARGGITKVIVPKANQKDLQKIPKETLDSIQVLMVEKYTDIYKELFN